MIQVSYRYYKMINEIFSYRIEKFKDESFENAEKQKGKMILKEEGLSLINPADESCFLLPGISEIIIDFNTNNNKVFFMFEERTSNVRSKFGIVLKKSEEELIVFKSPELFQLEVISQETTIENTLLNKVRKGKIEFEYYTEMDNGFFINTNIICSNIKEIEKTKELNHIFMLFLEEKKLKLKYLFAE